MTVLTEEEVAGAIGKFGQERGFNVLYGHALERLVAREVMKDSELSRQLEYIPNRQQTQEGGLPDFRGKGVADGLMIDITTLGQAQRKQSAGKYYDYILYQRPKQP